LCLLNLFIKIKFLFNQMKIKIDTHMKLIEKNKKKNKYYARLHMLDILSRNSYFLFLKINFTHIKH
jgi:hypothetical protein